MNTLQLYESYRENSAMLFSAQLIYIDCKNSINEKHCKLMVDTGANISLSNVDAVKDCKKLTLLNTTLTWNYQ